MAKVSRWLVLLPAGALMACGGMATRPPHDGDAAVENPDRQGAAGAPLVPCSGDPPQWEGPYACGTCGTDGFYPVVCSNGYLACPTSYEGSEGGTITVPSTAYVVNTEEAASATGQCAYLAAPFIPSFALIDPAGLWTARDPSQQVVLQEIRQGNYPLSAINTLLENRVQGEEAIRSLVRLTDMATGLPVEYSIGDPVLDALTRLPTLVLTPTPPLLDDSWYRVTVYPGEMQQLVACRTISTSTWKPLTAPQTHDFYTYSRPMIRSMSIADKGEGMGYLVFLFTEPLAAADMAAHPMAVVAVDGVELSSCMTPYPCANVSASPTELRLDVPLVPQSFTAITLRIPHALRSVQGGTILDGTVGNPYAAVDGDWAVYTFASADMVHTDNNIRAWRHIGR